MMQAPEEYDWVFFDEYKSSIEMCSLCKRETKEVHCIDQDVIICGYCWAGSD